MKYILFYFFLFALPIAANACPSCEAQAGVLSNVTHGGGPQSRWDLLIISVMLVIVIATLFFSIKWLIRPGEKGIEHIKRTVLNFE